MQPAERHMRADARRNHGRLLVAAREAFAEHGPDAPLDDIARRAAVGPGTLYRHFPTREALLAAVYLDEVEALAAQADELASSLPPEQAMVAWLRLQLEHFKQKRGLGAAVKAMLGADSETMSYCRDTMRRSVERILEPAKTAGVIRADLDGYDVLRLVHGVGLACESLPHDADRLLGIVIDGLRVRGE